MTHPTDTAKSEELKACPLCGSSAVVSGDHHPYCRWAPYHWVSCPECGCSGPEIDGEQPDEAIAAWNRRSSPPQNDAGVEGLREALQIASDTITAHHQWHAAQTDPDPEHGYIPADEYADSALYERTVDALDKIGRALNPVRDFAAHTPMSELQELGQEFEAGDTWRKHYDAMAKAAGELKAAIRPQLDAMPYADHAKVRKAFNDIAVVAGCALDFLQGRPLPSAPSGEV